MKIISKYLIVICLFLLVAVLAKAQTSASFNVSSAGSLPTLLGTQANSITDLTLTGYLNGTDIKAIREMTSLTKLNLAATTIVSGGVAYYVDPFGSRYTEKNRISMFMFCWCSNLKSVILPNSVTSIDMYAFYDCTRLESVIIPDNLTVIATCAFSNCKSLPSFSLSKNISNIDYSAFSGCIGLKQFFVDENNPYFSQLDGVLYNKARTKLLIYPNAIASQYEIPNGVTTIRQYAFAGCNDLTSVTIPNTVTTIEWNVFEKCTGLTTISIPSSVTYIGAGSFNNCTGLISASLSPNMNSISDWLFNGCTKLKSIFIPDGIDSVGKFAFKGCTNLSSVTLAGSVSYLNDGAFDSFNITEIHCLGAIPPRTEAMSLNSIDKSACKLFVPQGALLSYWTSSGWWEFVNVVEEAASAVKYISNDLISLTTENHQINVRSKELIQISVYELSGKKIFEQEIIGEAQIAVKTGVYLVKVGSQSKKIMVK